MQQMQNMVYRTAEIPETYPETDGDFIIAMAAIMNQTGFTPIVAVAVRVGLLVWSLPRPSRHHHVLKVLHAQGVPCDGDRGFVDAKGRFLTREQALVAARACGQIGAGVIGGVLTSEDLW
jgi:hypothetical protein